MLNRILGTDVKQQTEKDIGKALTYGFSMREQFMMVLGSLGYSLKLCDKEYQIFRYGKRQDTVSLEQVDAKIATFSKDISRLGQLRSVFAKYRGQYDPAVVHVKAPLPAGRSSAPSGYTSAMEQMLSDKFGIQIIFHGKDGKPPYGYTVIDHSRKIVYKGKDLMPLTEFIAPSENTPEISDKAEIKADRTEQNERELKTPSEGTATFIDQEQGISEQWIPNIQIDIADDIDDEAIHGRNRRRKRTGCTNTR